MRQPMDEDSMFGQNEFLKHALETRVALNNSWNNTPLNTNKTKMETK